MLSAASIRCAAAATSPARSATTRSPYSSSIARSRWHRSSVASPSARTRRCARGSCGAARRSGKSSQCSCAPAAAWSARFSAASAIDVSWTSLERRPEIRSALDAHAAPKATATAAAAPAPGAGRSAATALRRSSREALEISIRGRRWSVRSSRSLSGRAGQRFRRIWRPRAAVRRNPARTHRTRAGCLESEFGARGKDRAQPLAAAQRGR